MSSHWPSVEGVIDSSGFGGGNSPTRRVFLHYHFMVNGVRYEGTRFTPTGEYHGNEANADAFAAEHSPGQVVRVFYDPHDPSNAVLRPGLDTWQYLVAVGFVVVFLIVICVSFGFFKVRNAGGQGTGQLRQRPLLRQLIVTQRPGFAMGQNESKSDIRPRLKIQARQSNMRIFRPNAHSFRGLALAAFVAGCNSQSGVPNKMKNEPGTKVNESPAVDNESIDERTEQIVVQITVDKTVPFVGTIGAWPDSLLSAVEEVRGGRKFSGVNMRAPGKRLKVLTAIDNSTGKVEVILDSTVPFRIGRRLCRSESDDGGGVRNTVEEAAGSHIIYYDVRDGSILP
jgi:hypothetical protein